MWERFCKAMGRQQWVDNPDYATPRARLTNRDHLNGLIEEVTTELTTTAVVDRMNAAGIPCGPIYTIDQMFADPQVKHLGIAQTVQSPALGEISLVGQPFTMSRTPSSLATSAPEHGEHTDEILGELGFEADEIMRFKTGGAV